MFGIILGILLFMFLVLIHELGHFITAKKSGVKVLEFGIGIPPKVCKLRTDKSGTEYTLNLFPLGGFVRLKGEDQKNQEEFYAPDSLITAKLWKKVIIVCAGVVMNFLFAWLIFSVVFWKGTQPIGIIPSDKHVQNNQSYLIPSVEFIKEQNLIIGGVDRFNLIVSDIISGSEAERIGLQTGDIINSINGTTVNSIEFSSTFFEDNGLCGKEIEINISRGKEILNKTANIDADKCKFGMARIPGLKLLDTQKDFRIVKFGFVDGIKAGLKETYYQTKTTLVLLGQLGKNLFSFDKDRIKEATNSLSSPVGVTKIVQQLVELDQWTRFLALFGMISLALAIFNILPIPALDGGRLLGFFIQSGLRLKEEKYFNIEGYINLFFFVVLMGFGVYIMLKDLVRFRDFHIPFIG